MMQKMTTRLNANMDALMTQVEINNIADHTLDEIFPELIGEHSGSDDEYEMMD